MTTTKTPEARTTTVTDMIVKATDSYPRTPGHADECLAGMLMDVTYQGVTHRTRASLKAGCMLETMGATVAVVPSFEQQRTLAQWDAAGIGAN